MKLRNARSKLLTRREAAAAVRASRRRGERVVFTNGCFDLLHIGHVRSLEQARRLGERLVVAVNSDASVRQLKGAGRPIVPLRQRMEMLGALQCVDWVIQFREMTPLSAILALRPDVLAKGGDWAIADIVGREEIESWGGRVVRLREVPASRTSLILERVRAEPTAAQAPVQARTRARTRSQPGPGKGSRSRRRS